jgi:hypothetical protein
LGDEKYSVEKIGVADDHSDANGDDILTFFQAQKKAREIAAQAKAPAGNKEFTVADAMDAYFSRLEQAGSKSLAGSRGRSANHIIAALGDVLVAALTRDRLAKWLTVLAGGPDDGDAIRARKVSANRVLTILKAALNQAFRDGKVASDVGWRTVKPFAEVDSARVRYFTKDEVRRLINASQGDFRNLVKAAFLPAADTGNLLACALVISTRIPGPSLLAKARAAGHATLCLQTKASGSLKR